MLHPRAASFAFRDAGHGYDVFGLAPRVVDRTLRAARLLYQRYFRVTSHGAEHLPSRGAAILAANHSGVLPIDAAMLYLDVIAHTHPPRIPRPIVDLFVPRLPFVGTFFTRLGAVSGARGNVRRLLDAGELLIVFPEGSPGVAKPFAHRYQLQEWRVGHAELAIRHRAPVIPVAIIGAEEQWPLLGRIRWIKAFGSPYLPVPATPLPLPAHLHIHYGEPMELWRDLPANAADDPQLVAEAAARVEAAVAALIETGLRERKGVFR